MRKWKAKQKFQLSEIMEYVFPTRDQERIMTVQRDAFIYESQNAGYLVINGRQINGTFPDQWKSKCDLIETIAENEVGQTGVAVAGVETLNTLTGNVNIVAGTNVSVTTVGNDIRVSASGGGGDIYQFMYLVTSTDETNGFIDISGWSVVPSIETRVRISAVGGPEQVNADLVGSTGVQPDYEVDLSLGSEKIIINASGSPSIPLTGDIDAGAVVIVSF